jgi:Fur family iron response transcriptional regulator
MMQFDATSFSGPEVADAEWVPPPSACCEPGLDPSNEYMALLRRAGLRPTRQRLALSFLLFSKGNRHLTAEMLHAEASAAKVPVSLATVYNNLHQFTEVGLVRQISVDGSKAFFDTNPTEHHHFFLTGEHALLDIPAADVVVGDLPVPPDGYEIARVDVVVRLRRKRALAR